MRKRNWLMGAAMLAVLGLVMAATAQPPQGRGKGGFKGKGGPKAKAGPALDRILDDLDLPEAKREAAGAVVRQHVGDLRRLMDLARAELLMTVKDVLSDEEFHKFRQATDAFRDGPGGRGAGASVEEVIERIMSFDANKDGKITKDELPERMQDLITRGDTNGDGALDRDEIRKLAADIAREEGLGGGRDGRGPGRRGGPRGRGGFGGFDGPGGFPPPPPFEFDQQPGRRGRGGPPPGPPPDVIERAVADLKLTDKKLETATSAVKAHRDNLHKLTELARADLLLQMNGILNEEEYKSFKTSLERQPGLGDFPPPGRGRRGGAPGF